ncbi:MULTISPECIES: response regulator transcription factor [Micromonospora]|uniref:Two component transcriptional regulator, LuxR family n=1 Tax=Micromonospora yangpuensis TaxID=683228 RepID=A0A1C6UTJ4_9ACTN|nr:response regulator transcription factor [Micromonospora yangpuensis]GGM24772.1 DNA-binding response regulator [Micromonospora yangpuensis]SCL57346.1 two component transcriptional regulator, LuxR family [Micromonospora yangpuensis]
MTIRVVVVESMGLLRGALCAALSGQPDIDVAAEAAAVADLPTVVRRERPDVVVVDLPSDAPPETFEAIGEVERVAPGTAVLAMCGRWNPSVLRAAVAVGVRGFLGKDGPVDELVRMVRSMAAGERVIDPTAAVAALKPTACPLTRRELEVLRTVAEGLPLKETARRLFLAHGTVRNHLSAILHKTGSRNRLEAIRRAQRDGWL